MPNTSNVHCDERESIGKSRKKCWKLQNWSTLVNFPWNSSLRSSWYYTHNLNGIIITIKTFKAHHLLIIVSNSNYKRPKSTKMLDWPMSRTVEVKRRSFLTEKQFILSSRQMGGSTNGIFIGLNDPHLLWFNWITISLASLHFSLIAYSFLLFAKMKLLLFVSAAAVWAVRALPKEVKVSYKQILNNFFREFFLVISFASHRVSLMFCVIWILVLIRSVAEWSSSLLVLYIFLTNDDMEL